MEMSPANSGLMLGVGQLPLALPLCARNKQGGTLGLDLLLFHLEFWVLASLVLSLVKTQK